MTQPTCDVSGALVLVDGSALAYRSHHAMARSALSSPEGLPTGAVFGVVSELRRLEGLGSPAYAACVFDTPEPTFRHALFEDYKATREKMPEELVQQLPWIQKASEALGWRTLAVPGYEADDVIATLARAAEARGIPVVIVTGDKDLMQLVSEGVRIYRLSRGGGEAALLGPSEVRAEWSVPPGHITDLLALMGDASDNIPGIPGIGEKGAKKLLQGGRDLEEVLADPGPDVSTKVRSALKEHAGLGRLSKRLATLDTAVPLDVGLESLRFSGADAASAADLFRRLGFRRLTEEMQGRLQSGVARVPGPAYGCITTLEALRDWIQRLDASELVAVDTETTGLDPRRAELVGISASPAEGEAAFLPIRGLCAPSWEEAGGPEAVLERLRPFLEDPRPRKCGQNLKYDIRVLRRAGIRLGGIRTDSMVASYLVEAHERERNLDALALRHFGHVKIKTEALIGRGKDQITMDQVPLEALSAYASEDADYARRLCARFLPELDALGARRLHDEVEIPLIEVLAGMEDEGVRVDREKLVAMAAELEREVAALAGRIHAAAGVAFNPNSPRQLGEVLFERLRIHEKSGRRLRRTSAGWATGQEVLEEFRDHPVVALVLEYRSLAKLLGTYVAPLPSLIDPESGRIHTSYHQTVAQTGRLSSSDPNLQNIPIRTEVGRRIRAAFLARDAESVLVSADYSQVELRILAHLSEDPALLEAFREDRDIHRETAARVFGVPAAAIDSTMRSRAKAVNFGILYGMGPQRLARETGLGLEEARQFIDRYFEAFPAVRAFLDGLKELARSRGYAETLLGRRRRIPDLGSSNRALQVAAENMAVNTPIQGSAADILKVAMVRVDRRLRAEGRAARMILTVHDELVFDVPAREKDAVMAAVRVEMEGAFLLRVPLRVDLGAGPTWLDAH